MTVQRNSNSYFPQFYTVTEHFARRFDNVGRQLALRGRTRPAAVAWQRKLRAKLIQVLGVESFRAGNLRFLASSE